MRVSEIVVIFGVLRVVTTTDISAHGILTCRFKGPWCFLIRLIEEDTYVDDQVDKYGIRCGFNGDQPFIMSGNQDGDERGSEEYTFFFLISHNCTLTGKRQRFETGRARRRIDEDRVSLSFSMDVSKIGEETDSF
uniref:ZP domain-containing protein n=1 Tax=Caenorhabditis tropicalis TaxID=1561998 RepID=A0A1I7T5D6_9PELO